MYFHKGDHGGAGDKYTYDQKNLNKDKHTGKPRRSAAQEMYWLDKYWLCKLHGVEKYKF